MPDGPFLRTLRTAAPDSTPDAELLRRFSATGDDAAFELIVRRHADLVWRVCRGVLRDDPHAAEDAFQATFLALARKAGSIARGEVLAAWLYQVARRAALRARKHVRAGGGRASAVEDHHQPADFDLAPALHEEIDRLAAKFRAPVLLCFFEGHTHAEAAERLGWAVGTVASRLARAKDTLRARLTRRGLAPAAVAAALAGPPAAAVPPTLVRATAALAAGAAGAVPAPVLTLAEGVLSAMRLAKLKLTAAVAAAVVAAAGGMTVATWAATQPPPTSGGSGGGGEPRRSPDGEKAASDPKGAEPAKQRPGRGGWDRWARSGENLKRIARAVHTYADQHGHIPTDVLAADGTPLWSWRIHLLPYLDQEALHRQADLAAAWDAPKNKAVSAAVVKVFLSGAEPDGEPLTCFKRPTGPGTVHEPGRKLGWQHVADGTAHTLLVVEAGDPVPWAKPGTDFAVDPENPPTIAGPFAAGLNAVKADGTVISIPDVIKPAAAWKLCSRAGGEVLAPADWGGAVAWDPKARKDFDEVAKDVREATDEAVRRLHEAVRLEAAAQRLESALAEKKGADFPPAVAARLAELELITDGLKARRKHIADRLGVKVERLDEVLKEYMEKQEAK